MNASRVNLLKKNEQRYQGIVSRRFTMVCAVLTPILLIAVLGGIKLIQFAGLQSDLKAKTEFWAEMEPRLERFKAENGNLNTNRKVLELFDGWDASQLDLVQIMDDIQNAVPGNVQFNRMMIRGNILPKTYGSVEEMKLDFQFQIDGLAMGERAEKDIWRFQKELLATAAIADAFDFIDLTGMRKRDFNNGTSCQEFKINGLNKDEEGEQ